MPRSSAALVRAGYEAGARRVEVDYEDMEVLRSQIALAPDEAVGTATFPNAQAVLTTFGLRF